MKKLGLLRPIPLLTHPLYVILRPPPQAALMNRCTIKRKLRKTPPIFTCKTMTAAVNMILVLCT